VDGPLLVLAEAARQDPEHEHFLVIDEINRGNIAAIFGELYYLLEYRDRPISLTYGGEFRLPGNLYVIGTMNTADRSITMLDSALRRRFYVRDLRPGQPPVDGVLRRYLTERGGDLAWLADLLDHANALIDDPDQAVGPSHFMVEEQGPVELWARRAWDHTVLPTLREVFYGRADLLTKLEFTALKSQVSGGADDVSD
jgi:5-methylcytosine-specific restriction protein B